MSASLSPAGDVFMTAAGCHPFAAKSQDRCNEPAPSCRHRRRAAFVTGTAPSSSSEIIMTGIRLLAALLGSLALNAHASSQAYDLLIVACKGGECARVAEQTVGGTASPQAEYSRDGLRIRIDTLNSRAESAEARFQISVRPLEDGLIPARADIAGSQRVRIEVEPCTLRRGIFSSITAFHSDDTVYRVWARLATSR
jgi:hypothetical protein